MTYLNKLLLVVLTSLPLLVGADEEETTDTHQVKIKLPSGKKFAEDKDIKEIQSITCCQFLTPNIGLIAERLGLSARVEPLGLSDMAQQWGVTSLAEQVGVFAVAEYLGLPTIAKRFGFFNEMTTDNRIWTLPVLEKLTFGQLLQLARTFEIGVDELLLTGVRRALSPKQKID